MLRIFCFLLAVVWSGQGLANQLDQAEALILQNEITPALDILGSYTATSAAENERKMWAQVVAYGRLDQPRKALPVLERLVSLYPNSARYRLELAALLTRINQDDRARYHYSLLRSGADDPAIAAALDDRIATLDKRKSWEGHLTFALTPESNAARRTAADTVVIGGLNFALNPSAQAKSATGLRLAFGGAFLPLVATDTRARIGLSVDGRFFENNDAPDDVSVTGQIGLINFGDRARQLEATLHVAQRWIDGDRFSLTSGLTLSYSRLTGRAGAVSASARVQKVDYESRGVPSATETQLRLRYRHNLSSQLQLFAHGFVEFRDSISAEQAGTNVGIGIGGQYVFKGGVQLELEYTQSHLERDGASLLFGTRRQEDLSSITMRVLNRNWTAGGFTPQLEVGIEKQTSTIPLYSFDNTRVSLGVTRRF